MRTWRSCPSSRPATRSPSRPASRATHRGALATPQGEIPASGNAIDVPFADFFRLSDDNFVEHRGYWDQAGKMAQLSPAPPS